MDVSHETNLDEHKSIESHRVVLYVNGDNVAYFYRFGNQLLFQNKLKIHRQQNIVTNIYKTQVYDSVMCGYFCIGFIHFIFFLQI